MRRVFSAPADDLALAHDSAMGFTLIGPCMRRGGAPWLRAYDLLNRRIGWDGAPLEVAAMPAGRSFAVRGRNIYLANDDALIAFELFTGREKWRARFSDAVDTSERRGPSGGLTVLDPSEDGEGAIVVATRDRAITGVDRETGALLWRREYRTAPELQPIDRAGTFVCVEGGALEILAAGDGSRVAAFGGGEGEIARASVAGRCVIAIVRGRGPRAEEGVAVIDARKGGLLSFESAPGIDPRMVPVVGGGRVYVALGDSDRVCALPQTGAPAQLGTHTVSAMKAAGATLACVLRSREDRARRLVGFDARTLDVRFDWGDIGRLENLAGDQELQANHEYVIAAAALGGDHRQCELRAFDATTGRELWSRAAGEHRAHSFLGGHLVALAKGKLDILELETGKVVATYTAGI